MKRRMLWGLWVIAGLSILAASLATSGTWRSRETASAKIVEAYVKQIQAESDQKTASLANINAIEFRLRAEREPSEENIRLSAEAVRQEQNAYQRAQTSWEIVVGLIDEALQSTHPDEKDLHDSLRLLKGRASIGAGRLGSATADLEDLLAGLSPESQDEFLLRQRVKEEISTAYYYGARLMRMTGAPEQEWELVAERAREFSRSLVEDESAFLTDNDRRRYQRNHDTILDTNELSLDELRSQPNPQDSPSAKARGLELDNWPWRRPGRRPGTPNDARDGGAGGAGGGGGGGGS